LGQGIGLTVDPRRDEPIYRQIFDQVVHRIETRAFPGGFKLPPSRVLAQELRTRRNTVARAYADLEASGFVSSTVGRGTFVQTHDGAPSAPQREQPPGRMSWAALLSRGAQSERLARAERYARHPSGRDVVNLARMQPSADLLPDDLMRRSLARVLAEHGSAMMTYAPPDGVLALREQIALELASRGVPAMADDLGARNALVWRDTSTAEVLVDVLGFGWDRRSPSGRTTSPPGTTGRGRTPWSTPCSCWRRRAWRPTSTWPSGTPPLARARSRGPRSRIPAAPSRALRATRTCPSTPATRP